MFGTSCLLYTQKAQAQLTCFPSPLPHSNGSKLPSFPLDPPFDPPKPAPTHALIRLICLPTELQLVHLERAEQYSRWQPEGDLRRSSGTWVRVHTHKRALQHHRAARGRRGQRPAQHAPSGHVRPFAPARRRAASGAGRARTKVQLDGNIV
jgi:hypothetical protein